MSSKIRLSKNMLLKMEKCFVVPEERLLRYLFCSVLNYLHHTKTRKKIIYFRPSLMALYSGLKLVGIFLMSTVSLNSSKKDLTSEHDTVITSQFASETLLH